MFIKHLRYVSQGRYKFLFYEGIIDNKMESVTWSLE
jgi:hypothetical protein